MRGITEKQKTEIEMNSIALTIWSVFFTLLGMIVAFVLLGKPTSRLVYVLLPVFLIMTFLPALLFLVYYLDAYITNKRQKKGVK